MFAFIKRILRKSQMSLFDWQPTHQEAHHREGYIRHTASGAAVTVAQTMAKVTVRGQEGSRLQHGQKIYYRVPDQPRKKKGTVIGGSHEDGHIIQPVREGYNFKPPQVTATRDNIWTPEEHAAEGAKSGIRIATSAGGSTIAPEESRRRAEEGQERSQLNEADVLKHPEFVKRMKGTLAHLAGSNGFNPNYSESNGVLHNDDPDANELYSEYITAAMNSLRTETSKAPQEDIDAFRQHLARETNDSRIMMSITRAGKTAATRHLIANNNRLQNTHSYDGTMEDDQENGMRAIAAHAHHVPEHEGEAAKKANLAQGIEEQLDALDDPVAASIIKMKFGLGRFEHGYKEQDIAAALNRAGVRSESIDQWDAQAVKDHMQAALVRLAKTKGAKQLLNFLKSMREEITLRKSQMSFDFSGHDHHVAYTRTNANGTVSNIKAKGTPTQKKVEQHENNQENNAPEKPPITKIIDPKRLTPGMVVYHGTRGTAPVTKGKSLYLTGDPYEAQAYALGKIPGTVRGSKGEPVVRSFTVNGHKQGMDINAEVEDALMEGDEIDDVVDGLLEKAKNKGYDYVTFDHPTASDNKESAEYFPVIVLTRPEEWTTCETTSYDGNTMQAKGNLAKSRQEYSFDLVDRFMLIKSHIKQYTRQDGTVVQSHEDKRVRKHQDVLKHQNEHQEEIHTGARISHGEQLAEHLKSRGWTERQVHPVRPDEGHKGGKKEEMPEHEEIKAKNRDNGALQTAERAMKKMYEAAKASDDPVSVLQNINTSRSNTYTAAIDDYREKLLKHFGHDVDRNSTATKYEKDGHAIIMSKLGDKHVIHFAGGDPSKDKEAITSLQGKKEVQSVDTGKKEPKFIMGKANKAYTAKMNEVHSKYALVESDDLTTSHTIQGHVNKAYPQEIQPRERERLSSQMQMANMMNDIKPELFGAGSMAAHGAPIVGKDGAVESGNGRTIALTEAYKRDLGGKYKEWLKGEADQFGLKPEDVEKMKSPVLVRVRNDDDPNTDRAEFAREANDTGNLGSSPAEQAWSDASRIDDTLLKKFTVDEDGEIYNDDNMDFINGFMDKLGKNEAAGLRDADGDPNKKCIERIQNAVFTKVYGSSMLTELQAESAKPKIRNVLKALNGCVGDFAQVKGHDDLDVVPDMMEAIEYTLSHQSESRNEMEHNLRNAGALDFTGDTPTFKTEFATDMILAISDRTGSRNRLENVFRAISNGIKDEVASRENPEVDMFSGPAEPKTKEQVVKQALDKVRRSDDGIRKSFYGHVLTHLIKSHGGTNGRTEREGKVRQEGSTLKKSACGCGPGGCSGRKEGCGCENGKEADQITKSHVSAYDRTTASGALAHIDAHEDSRVKRYAIKLARARNSSELHALRQERFAHLPHWGTLDDHTKKQILDAEDEVHAGHKHWEQWKAEHIPDKGRQKKDAMLDHLPGDHSGLHQIRLFKARKHKMYLLRKSHVKAYTRTTASGATVTVQEHDDNRTSAQHTANAISAKADKGHKDPYQHATNHMDAAHGHAQAAREAADRGDHKAEQEHIDRSKHHITQSTGKLQGKGSAASAASDHARSMASYGGDIAKHAHQHAADAHNSHADSLGMSHPGWGRAAGTAATHEKRAKGE